MGNSKTVHLVWVKVTDVAGNERVTLGRVIVPQPVSFFNPLPTIITSTKTPLPPADLFDPEDSPTNATPQSSSFGGSTTTAKDNSQQSLSLASGTVSASASTTTNSNILWGATAAAMLGAVTAYILDEKRKREEDKARETQEQERRTKMKVQKMAKLEAQWAQERMREQARLEEQQAKMQQDAVARMETKMERIETEDDARWTASQAATYERAEAKKKAEDLQAGLAAYYSAMRQGEKEAQLKAEKEKPWWQKAWDTAKTFVQKKIVEPAQKAWNQYVYMPIVQPVVRWWKEEIPVWAKETGLSLIPIVGDGWGVIRQAIHFFKNEPVDKVDVSLSIVGLIFDIPWPQEGIIGGDVAIAVLKGLNAAIPSGPARDVMTQLIKDGLKNPDDIARIVKTSEALLKNDRLLQALIENPQALESVVRYGPEAVDVLGKYGDDAVELVGKYGDAGINLLSKNELTPDEISKLAGLPNEAAKLSDDVASKIDDDYKNNPLRLEYENKVTGLKEQLQEILQRNGGVVTEADAKALSEIRHNLGIEYKDVTPSPLRDYIYEQNSIRYKGNPLGPDWEFLMEKYDGDYLEIATAATHPNSDINKFLSGFDEWLKQKDMDYLLEAELKILRGE